MEDAEQYIPLFCLLYKNRETMKYFLNLKKKKTGNKIVRIEIIAINDV